MTKKGFDPPRIIIGSEKENPVRLTRQDMRGPNAGWAAEAEGRWFVKIDRAGEYEVTVRGNTPFDNYGIMVDGKMRMDADFGLNRPAPGSKALSTRLALEAGDAELSATLRIGGKDRGAADYVELKYLGPPKK